MATTDDPEGRSDWVTGFGVLFVAALAAGAGAIVLQSLGVPFGVYVGGIVGAVLGFVAISWLFYGR